ncbi:MAG: hypothetical protein IJO90_07160, partial [Alistipes sp.]|nr:hypothetical protein [Alistipes sp.]
MTNAAATVLFDITLPEDEVIKSVTMTSENVGIAGSCKLALATPYAYGAASKSLTLSYPSQPKGHSADGWATIAPVNFKSATGSVLYDIKTADGQYIFNHKPTEEYKAGGVYTITLSVEQFEQVADSGKLK